MSNPKEKAKELVDRYVNTLIPIMPDDDSIYFVSEVRYIAAKQCALIAVDEILVNFGTLTEGKQHYAANCTIVFYEQVKEEIKRL